MGLAEVKERSENIAVVTFDSAVRDYNEILRYLSLLFIKEKFNIIKIGCDEALSSCTSKYSRYSAFPNLKMQVDTCKSCKNLQKKISSNLDFNIKNTENQQKIYKSYEKKLFWYAEQSGGFRELLNYEYQGYPVGRNAYFDFSINGKVSLISKLSSYELENFVLGIVDQIRLVDFFCNLINEVNFTKIIYINGNYSQNTLIRQISKMHGDVSCLSVEPQFSEGGFFYKICFAEDRIPLSQHWNQQIKTEPNRVEKISEFEVVETLKIFKHRYLGNSFNSYTAFGKDKNLVSEQRSIEILKRNYDRVISVFMSSSDEVVPHIETHSNDGLTNINSENIFNFDDQFSLFKYLIEFCNQNSNIVVLVRLHPRMAKNKRDSFGSKEGKFFQEFVDQTKMPGNLVVIAADKKLSSYYLLLLSDLVLVTWSTIGLEASLLGKKVIATFPERLMYPLTSLSNQPQSREELTSALLGEIELGVSDDEALLKWLVVNYNNIFCRIGAVRGITRINKFIKRIFLILTKFNIVYYLYVKLFLSLSRMNLVQSLIDKPTYKAAQNKKILATVDRSTNAAIFSKILEEYRASARKYFGIS